MTSSPITNGRWLLDQLEDPFVIFPVESVSDTLFEAVYKAESRKVERMGPWGVARKYWSVEEEHYHMEVGLLVGAIFVLGQAAITQTVSILSELRKLPEARCGIPKSKAGKMATNAELEVETGVSKIVIINAASNYFKHANEWPLEWDTVTRGPQAETIDIALQVGMSSSGEVTDNLLIAANLLGLRHSNPRAVAGSIQEWREAWAGVLYPHFGFPDPNKELRTKARVNPPA